MKKEVIKASLLSRLCRRGQRPEAGRQSKDILAATEEYKILSVDEAQKAIQARIGGPFFEAKKKAHTQGFYGECNDFLCGPVGTMYATAVYFAYATKLRNQLPLIHIPQQKALLLLQLTDRVRAGLGEGGSAAFWSEIQDSIGQLVTTESGFVVPYSSFCRSLSSDYESYFRLFNFYIDISMKAEYQLKSGNEALRELYRELVRLLDQDGARGVKPGRSSNPVTG